MIKGRELKEFRAGNIRIVNRPLNMQPPREVVGRTSVLQNRHTLGIFVKRYFTDVDGRIVDKADAGLVAAGMNVNYPVYMLGQLDRESGFPVGQNVVSPIAPAKYYMTFVNGYQCTTNQIVTPFSGVNAIQPLLKLGDIVTVYTDDLNAPNYFCWIVQSMQQRGLSSIIANLATSQKDNRLMKLFCEDIRLIGEFTQPAQLIEAWNYTYLDNLGNPKVNQVSYDMFDSPFRVSNDTLTIDTQFEFNQYVGIYLYMALAVDTLNINFNLKIIE